MLNHAIDNLTTVQEDVFLTRGMIAFTRTDGNRRCFLGALDEARSKPFWDSKHYPCAPREFAVGPFNITVTSDGWYDHMLAVRFNELCQKLEGVPVAQRMDQHFGAGCANGAARLGILIRERIVENRARRTLQSVEPRVLAPVGTDV